MPAKVDHFSAPLLPYTGDGDFVAVEGERNYFPQLSVSEMFEWMPGPLWVLPILLSAPELEWKAFVR